MKKFITLFCMFIFGMININAFDLNDTFYYDKKVENMYITKVKGNLSTNGAPFLLHNSKGNLVYCIDPFLLLDKGIYNGYIGYNDVFGISEDKINKMNIIAHYGYGYENHTDLKWYGLTQYLIWETLELDDIYFTDSFNGKRIVAYQDELQELRSLVDNYYKVPSFNSVINMEANTKLTLTDTNNVLNDYEIISDINVKKENNNLVIEDLEEGSYKIEFVKKDNDKDYILYYNAKGQDLLLPGKINDVKKEITINVKSGKLNVSKHDKITDSPREYLTFKDAVYGIYDDSGNLIDKITLDDLGKASIKLKFGHYYLQEIEAPVGYLKNDIKYYFEITFENNDINLDVYDNVISKNVKIYKLYGNKKSGIYSYEEGATFELYDEYDNLIGTYVTDENGIINLTLSYGKYRIHQVSSKEGYDIVDDYVIDVTDTTNEEIKLYDYEQIINVPNTYKDEINYKGSIFILVGLLVFNIGVYAYRKNLA